LSFPSRFIEHHDLEARDLAVSNRKQIVALSMYAVWNFSDELIDGLEKAGIERLD